MFAIGKTHAETKEVACEVYPTDKGMNKQMKYANDKDIPFVILMGSKEIEADSLTVKNMETGAQEEIKVTDFLNQL